MHEFQQLTSVYEWTQAEMTKCLAIISSEGHITVGTSIEKVETELFQHSAAMNVQVTCDENMTLFYTLFIYSHSAFLSCRFSDKEVRSIYPFWSIFLPHQLHFSPLSFNVSFRTHFKCATRSSQDYMISRTLLWALDEIIVS